WGVAHFGGSLVVAPETRLSAALSAGPGSSQEESFSYLKGRAGISRQFDWRSGFVGIEALFLDIDRAQGTLLQGTAGLVVAASHRFTGTYGRSIGGNLATDFVNLRWDGAFEEHPLFLGIAHGESRPELFGVFGTLEAQDVWEVFAGTTVTRGDRGLTLVVSYQEVESRPRSSLTLVARLPRVLGGTP
ncbi:MAG: hypothetical protein K8J08_10665, partial [Thermoanaerobaculia bacterium]|nr:hypothetical protein [Thermoanaerobaculia bacterium]